VIGTARAASGAVARKCRRLPAVSVANSVRLAASRAGEPFE
jgi:hypothetical protein